MKEVSLSPVEQPITDQRQTQRWAQPFKSLGCRNYRLLWLSSWTEHMGQFMELAAVLWLVHEMTGSPLLLTIVGTSRFIPPVILGFFGGIVADRVDRRSLLVWTFVWMGLLSVCLTTLVFTGWVKVWHIVVISLLQSSAISFNHPARQSIIPNLVKREHLMNVIALNQFSVIGARVIGMVFAGYLLAIVGVAPVIAARAVGAFIAMIFLLLTKIPPTPAAARKTTPWQNVIDGVHYIRDNTVVLSLASMYIIIQFATITSTSLMPAFAKEILGLGAEGYGWLNGVMAAGSFFATLILASLPNFRKRGLLLISAGMVLGVALFGFSQSRWVFLSFLLLLFAGGANSIFHGLNTTVIQETISDDMRGRVMSLREVAYGLGSLAALLAGVIGEWAGVTFAIGVLGVMVFAMIMSTALFLPSVRKMA